MQKDLPSSIFFLSVMNGAAWGGSEELWYQSALWCASNNYKVSICCFEWIDKKEKLDKLSAAGCTLYLLPGKEKPGNFFSAKMKITNLVASIPFEDADIVIINQGGWKDIAYAPFEKLYLRLKKYVLLFHNYNEQEKLSRSRQQSLDHWVKNSFSNMAASWKIFQVIQQKFKISIPNQDILLNPITIPIPPGPISYPEIMDTYKFSVFAALETERKAQDILINTLALPEWKNKNWELHVYGEGKDKNSLKNLIQNKNLDQKVFIHGKAADYAKAVSESHLVLQITRIDAMPLSVLEAMAMARPLVVSNVGDMPVWVKQNENGWVCMELNEKSISKTLEIAWSNCNRWEEMGKKSFEIFKEKFPQDPVVYFLKQCGFNFTP